MSLCWDCGPRNRSLPLAGLLERRRKLLRAGGKPCVKAWTAATTVGPPELYCVSPARPYAGWFQMMLGDLERHFLTDRSVQLSNTKEPED